MQQIPYGRGWLYTNIPITPWKINILNLKNGGLVQMIFLFKQVIFRFKMFIFRGVFKDSQGGNDHPQYRELIDPATKK